MKERPIIFSTPMVQAILYGQKTMTRRIIKPQPDDSGLWNDTLHPRSVISDLQGWNGAVESTGESKEFKCPYGQPGDILWVRETFFDCEKYREAPLFMNSDRYLFKANSDFIGCHKWKPSIHMPREAARIFLQVKDITVERLQDITGVDALMEGMQWNSQDLRPIRDFQNLWNKIHGLTGPGSWDANPWVWVIKFGRIDK